MTPLGLWSNATHTHTATHTYTHTYIHTHQNTHTHTHIHTYTHTHTHTHIHTYTHAHTYIYIYTLHTSLANFSVTPSDVCVSVFCVCEFIHFCTTESRRVSNACDHSLRSCVCVRVCASVLFTAILLTPLFAAEGAAVHHTSYIIHHASYIIHHTSYIIHRTSYIIHHTFCLVILCVCVVCLLYGNRVRMTSAIMTL